MPVPSAISDLSTTAGSNSPSGSESPTTADDYFRAHASFLALLRDGKGASAEVTVASGATTDIGGAASPLVLISGTTTITSFGTNYSGARIVRFSGALTLTHNATTLILPGGANITTAAGDSCLVEPIGSPGSGWKVVAYTVAALAPGVANTSTTAGNVTGTVAVANGGTGVTTSTGTGNTVLSASPTLTGTPVAPTAATATDTTQLATTAFVHAVAKGTYSLNSSGYQKLDSGLVIQWGVTANTTGATETFPLAFPTFCAAIAFSNNSTNNAGFVSARSTTSFTWSCGAATTLTWIAIGY